MKFFRILLLPFSIVFWLIIRLRNFLFDSGILKSKSFPLPIISFGNILVGGTGKTPHSEYVLKLLKGKYNVAYLSRGYGRKTNHFIELDENSSPELVGDEAIQIKNKLKNLVIAVDKKRVNGIQQITKKYPETDVIVLDDAFQHRSVKPGMNILLTPYTKLFLDDFMLPAGNLREPLSNSKRADAVIVTKCPEVLTPIEKRQIEEKIKIQPDQKLFFSYLKYGDFVPFLKTKRIILNKDFYFDRRFSMILFTGIADASPLLYFLKRYASEVHHIEFGDHHNFKKTDLEKVIQTFKDLPKKDKIIVTTEKDSMRLKSQDLKDLLINYPLFYIPIEIAFHQNETEFDNYILKYVEENKRNR